MRIISWNNQGDTWIKFIYGKYVININRIILSELIFESLASGSNKVMLIVDIDFEIVYHSSCLFVLSRKIFKGDGKHKCKGKMRNIQKNSLCFKIKNAKEQSILFRTALMGISIKEYIIYILFMCKNDPYFRKLLFLKIYILHWNAYSNNRLQISKILTGFIKFWLANNCKK